MYFYSSLSPGLNAGLDIKNLGFNYNCQHRANIYQEQHFEGIKNYIILIDLIKISLMTQKITLGYWGLRGRGQVPRLLLSYSGLKFQETIYTDFGVWFGKDKHSLGLSFPNLPYIIQGDIKVTQSSAVQRHIIRASKKTQLLGKNIREMALLENLISAWEDILEPLSALAFNKKWEDERAGLFYKLKTKFEKVQSFINNKTYCLGYLTLADFIIAEGSYYFQRFYPQEYPKYSSFEKIRNTIESLPSTIAYYQRPNAIKTPFLPPSMITLPFELSDVFPKDPSLMKQSSLKSSPQKKPQVIHKVVLISGSLRKSSTNTGLLRAVVDLKIPGLSFEWANISDVPLLNEDLFQNPPKQFLRVQEQVKNSDAILFAIPQNNSDVSAPLKNIFDWLTRVEFVMKQKIAGMVSSGADQGGKRAQSAFKNIVAYSKVKLMVEPQITVKRYSGQYFDEEGNLTHEQTRQELKNFLQSFIKWITANK